MVRFFVILFSCITLSGPYEPPSDLSKKAKRLWKALISDPPSLSDSGMFVAENSVHTNSGFSGMINKEFEKALKELSRHQDFHKIIAKGDQVQKDFLKKLKKEVIQKNKFSLNMNLKQFLIKSLETIPLSGQKKREIKERPLTHAQIISLVLEQLQIETSDRSLTLENLFDYKNLIKYPRMRERYNHWYFNITEFHKRRINTYSTKNDGIKKWLNNLETQVTEIKNDNINKLFPIIFKHFKDKNLLFLIEISDKIKEDRYYIENFWRLNDIKISNPEANIIPISEFTLNQLNFKYQEKQQSPFRFPNHYVQALKYLTIIDGKEYALIFEKGAVGLPFSTDSFIDLFSEEDYFGKKEDFFELYVAAKSLDESDSHWDRLKSSFFWNYTYNGLKGEKLKAKLSETLSEKNPEGKIHTGSKYSLIQSETYRRRGTIGKFMNKKSYINRLFFWGIRPKEGSHELNWAAWEKRDKKAKKSNSTSFFEYYRRIDTLGSENINGYFKTPAQLSQVNVKNPKNGGKDAIFRHSFTQTEIYFRLGITSEISQAKEVTNNLSWEHPPKEKNRYNYIETLLLIRPLVIAEKDYVAIPTPVGYRLKAVSLRRRSIDTIKEKTTEEEKVKNFKVKRVSQGSYFIEISSTSFKNKYSTFSQYGFVAVFEIDPDFKVMRPKIIEPNSQLRHLIPKTAKSPLEALVLNNKTGLKRVVLELQSIGLDQMADTILKLGDDSDNFTLKDLEIAISEGSVKSDWPSNGKFTRDSLLGGLTGYVNQGKFACDCTALSELSYLLLQEIYGTWRRDFSVQKSSFFRSFSSDHGIIQKSHSHRALEGRHQGKYFLFDPPVKQPDPRGSYSDLQDTQNKSQDREYSRSSKKKSHKNESPSNQSTGELKDFKKSLDFYIKSLSELYVDILELRNVKLEKNLSSLELDRENLAKQLMKLLTEIKIYFQADKSIFDVYKSIKKFNLNENITLEEARVEILRKVETLYRSFFIVEQMLQQGKELPKQIWYLNNPTVMHQMKAYTNNLYVYLRKKEMPQECPRYLREID